jgi:hypothetical protein
MTLSFMNAHHTSSFDAPMIVLLWKHSFIWDTKDDYFETSIGAGSTFR